MSTWFNPTRTHTGDKGKYICDLHPTDLLAFEKLEKDYPSLTWYIEESYVQFGMTGDRLLLEDLLYPEKIAKDFISPEEIGHYITRLEKSLEYYEDFTRIAVQSYLALFNVLHNRGIGIHVSY